MKTHFRCYTDTAGEYRWQLIAANGQVVATAGESFKSKQGCHDNIRLVKDLSGSASVVEDHAKKE